VAAARAGAESLLTERPAEASVASTEVVPAPAIEETDELIPPNSEPESEAESALATGAESASHAVAAAPARSKGRSVRHGKRAESIRNTPHRLLEKFDDWQQPRHDQLPESRVFGE
jgi:hypothetical protein